VVFLDSETNEVRVDTEALNIISQHIQGLDADRVAIVSVMGAYRTGKSFLLDLFLRYLRHNESQSSSSDASGCPTTPSDSAIPEWLKSGGDIISEGHADTTDLAGFQWRGGMDKVTEGLWLWSHPFILRGRSDGQNLAVLLMDSQGAFDSKMTKEQSATIFGLTAVLSSLQIYNVSMQLQEDKIESLHYFMECANSCVRYLTAEQESADDEKTSIVAPTIFQHLQFLVRDWPNYEAGWDIQQCRTQMAAHLSQHMDSAREGSTPESLKKMFEEISCFMLPHPGLQISKVGWNGSISDLDPEFIRFLDVYVRDVFGEKLNERVVLGSPLSPTSFVDVIDTFVGAFKGLVPKGDNLANAIAKSTNLLSKEKAISDFKASVEKFMHSPDGSQGVGEEIFERIETSARESAFGGFISGTRFGSTETRDPIKADLEAELLALSGHYKVENRRRSEAALTVFSGLAVVLILFYAVDKVSDFACDWYSDTCVRMSNALFMIYFTIFVAILSNAFMLYQSRGQAMTFVAMIELGKSATSLLFSYATAFRDLLSDISSEDSTKFKTHLRGLLDRIWTDIMQGVNALRVSIRAFGKRSIEPPGK
jgi:atlastin